MDTIKKTSAALALKLKECADIEAQTERAKAAINAAVPGADALDTLRQQRNDEIGRAFIEKRPEDLAGIDAAIGKIEKEVADIRAAGEAAGNALHLLTSRSGELESELAPLREAQDAAINAFSAVKTAEAHAMLTKALADVGTAFAHMAAAEGIDRKPISGWSYAGPNWKHQRDLHCGANFNIQMKDFDGVYTALKVELSALGVTDPGVKRREKPAAPTPPTPDPVVKITFLHPKDEQDFSGGYVPGFAGSSYR